MNVYTATRSEGELEVWLSEHGTVQMTWGLNACHVILSPQEASDLLDGLAVVVPKALQDRANREAREEQERGAGLSGDSGHWGVGLGE